MSLVILWTRGSVLPFWDEWDATAPIAIKAADGTLTLADIFRQHNEHKIVFSKVITALGTWLTHWNMRVESLVSVGLGFLIVFLFSLNLRRQKQSLSPLLLTGIVSALVFALRDYGNLIIPVETVVFLVLAFYVGAATALYCIERRWLALGVAAGCGLCATFSFLNGALIWPLGLLLLPLLGYRRWRYLAFWVGAAILTMLLFFGTGYQFVSSINASSISVPLLTYLYYMLAYLGGLFVPGSAATVPLAAVIGLGGLVYFLLNITLLYRRGRLESHTLAFWLLVAGYSVGTAAVSAVGRAALFVTSVPNQPLETRYVLHTVPFWLAVIALALHTLPLEGLGWVRMGNRLLLVGLLFGYVVINSTLFFVIRPVVTESHVACALAYPTRHDLTCLSGIYPDELIEGLRPRLEALAEHKLAVFAETQK
jgi:hypothetical protein